jgi:hypothetical protein
MTTAMTRATIAIVRVSMARPYSVSPAVSPDPPSGTPLPLTDGWGRPERLLAGSRSGRRGAVVRARVAAAGATVRSRLRRAAPVPRPSLEARLRRSQAPGRGVGGAGLAARACAVLLVAARHTGCCDGGRVVRRGASDAWSPSSARCAGSLGSGMQRARGRRVDRRVAIVPFDPVPRRRIAAQDVQHAARSRRPVRGLGLGDDSILDLERHGSFFHLGCTAEANRPPGRPPPRRPPLPG